MKAWIVDGKFGLGSLKIVERETPKPKRGEVLVRVRAVSLNYRDLAVVEGHYNPALAFPFVPVSDGAGEVAAVGEGVTRAKVGDRVSATFGRWEGGKPTDESTSGSTLGTPRPGLLAEYVLLDERDLVHIPEQLSFEEASTLPIAGVTAWHALFVDAPLQPGDSVLVQGTGGVAAFAIQLARAAGAHVYVVSSSDEKLTRALRIGAHEGINYTKEPDWDARILERTGGVGVDHVIDVAGSTLARSIRAVRVGGQVSTIGFLGGMQTGVDLFPLIVRNVRVQGIWVGTRGHFEDLIRALVRHRIHPVIDRTYPFEKANEAIAALRGGAYVGKLVIDVTRAGTAAAA